MAASIKKAHSIARTELEDLVADLRDILSNSETLTTSPEAKAIRARLEDAVSRARDAASDAAQRARDAASDAAHEAAEQARRAAYAADDYAHDEPWRVAGTALAVGALLGFLLGRR
jgi:ElaB/YqjD/DUF883 family membrane-anchored ribosome-binding protein